MKSLFATSIAAYSLFFAPLPLDAAEISVDVRFSTREASIIRDFYRQPTVNEAKGKKGPKSLPPGIAKNLARGKPLPPGIAKQVLPGALISQLPPTRDGFERVILDGKILLVEIATQMVHDVLADAILK
jgi:hypothetical protein